MAHRVSCEGRRDDFPITHCTAGAVSCLMLMMSPPVKLGTSVKVTDMVGRVAQQPRATRCFLQQDHTNHRDCSNKLKQIQELVEQQAWKRPKVMIRKNSRSVPMNFQGRNLASGTTGSVVSLHRTLQWSPLFFTPPRASPTGSAFWSCVTG